MAKWLERELEDYVIANFDDVFCYIDEMHTAAVLGRQVHCRYGIIDLLAYQESTLFIFEFKAVRADDNVAGQLARYRRAINDVSLPAEWDIDMLNRYPLLVDFPIYTVALAPSFTDRALHGIDSCIEATKTPHGFAFRKCKWPRGDKGASRTLQTVLRPYFDSLLQSQMQRF